MPRGNILVINYAKVGESIAYFTICKVFFDTEKLSKMVIKFVQRGH